MIRAIIRANIAVSQRAWSIKQNLAAPEVGRYDHERFKEEWGLTFIIMNNYLYRGINSDMFRESGGLLKPHGNQSVAELYPSDHLYPSDRLLPGKHEKNAVDKHQNPNRFNEADFKNQSAYLSTTPVLSRALHYATSGNRVSGVVFIIDRSRLKQLQVTDYRVSEIATIITVPEDEEVLLLTNPLGSPLSKGVIVEIRHIDPNQYDTVDHLRNRSETLRS